MDVMIWIIKKLKHFQKEAAEYGIDSFPTLVVFENGIPNLYDGGFDNGDKIIEWIVAESTGDNTIEIVTDNMLDQIVATFDNVAVVFYKKGDEDSELFIEKLEHIDDEANENEFPIKIVRIDDDNEAAEYGIDTFPTLVYFDKKISSCFQNFINFTFLFETLFFKFNLLVKDHLEILFASKRTFQTFICLQWNTFN